MKLNIFIPKDFTFLENGGFECFDNNRPLNLAFTCLNNKLISKSSECIMFITLDRLFTPEDSIFFSKISPSNRPFNSNLIPANNLQRQISNLTNEGDNWKDKIHYMDQSEAKETFNADTAVYFHLELKENMIYEKKFKNIISLMIQKKGRGFVNVIFFYTENTGLNDRKILDLLKTNIYYRN